MQPFNLGWRLLFVKTASDASLRAAKKSKVAFNNKNVGCSLARRETAFYGRGLARRETAFWSRPIFMLWTRFSPSWDRTLGLDRFLCF
jgi:hypothetical protein